MDSTDLDSTDAKRTRSAAEETVRRRQVRGLLLLAAAALAFAILRAGVHRVFSLGWWRLW